MKSVFIALLFVLLQATSWGRNPMSRWNFKIDPSRVKFETIEAEVVTYIDGTEVYRSRPYENRAGMTAPVSHVTNRLNASLKSAIVEKKWIELSLNTHPGWDEFMRNVEAPDFTAELDRLKTENQVLQAQRDTYKAKLEKCYTAKAPLLPESSVQKMPEHQ